MRLDEEAKAFHYAVYETVLQIPYGNVTSYGHIAYLIGRPQNSRQVGSSLKHSEYIVAQLNQEGAGISNLPWWRVILSLGMISKRDGDYEQARRLKEEGIDMNGMKVDLDMYGWFPDDV